MFFADYCMDPNENALNSVTSDLSSLFLNYIINCPGNNQFSGYLEKLSSLNLNTHTLDLLSSVVNNRFFPAGSCKTSLNNAFVYFGVSNQTLTSLSSTTECIAFNRAWYEISNAGICGKFFSGLFESWLCISIATTLIFVSVCMINKLFVKYNPEESNSVDPSILAPYEQRSCEASQLSFESEEKSSLELTPVVRSSMQPTLPQPSAQSRRWW